MSKVVFVTTTYIKFDSGHRLWSDHDRSCCEDHYLDFGDLTLNDFAGLEFYIDGEFFERVEDYGIRLIPIDGHPVPIPGYGSNNGYYSSDLTLVLSKDGETDRTFDITECQVIN